MNISIVMSYIGRLFIALALSMASAFIYAAGVFVYLQPAGKLRGIFLLSLLVNSTALAISIAVFGLSAYAIRKPTKITYFAAITFFLLGVVFWSLIDRPPLSDWLLPLAQGK